MRRLALVAALALATALPAADTAPAPAPELPDTLAAAPLAVTLKQNANIRFGPSLKAKTVVTLPAGTAIEVFGPAHADKDWLVVRFPKQGKVWVHVKSLKQIGDGVRWQVTTDKARARDDATLAGNVVCELALGEVVEDKGQVVGDWRAVYMPDAVAYVAAKLVSLPADVEKAIGEREQRALNAEGAWQGAVVTYNRFLATIKDNPKAAVGCDWAGLAAVLDSVIADHASASTRRQAQAIREGVAQVVAAATAVAKQDNVQPPAPLPTPGTAATAAPATPAGPKADPGPKALTAAQLAEITKVVKPSPYQAEGLLVTDDAYAKAGGRDVIMDADGNVAAVVVPRAGIDLKLSEYSGRDVGVKGTVEVLPPEKTGLSKPVKVVTAVEVVPLRR